MKGRGGVGQAVGCGGWLCNQQPVRDRGWGAGSECEMKGEEVWGRQ